MDRSSFWAALRGGCLLALGMLALICLAAGFLYMGPRLYPDAVPGSDNLASLPLQGERIVKAAFAKPVELAVNVSGSGWVVRSAEAPYVTGDSLLLLAAPAQGWSFAGWSGDLEGAANPVTVTLDGDLVVLAAFERLAESLAVDVSGEGSVSRSSEGPYFYGDVVVLSAAPAQGWRFTGWSGDLAGAANPVAVTLDGSKTIAAMFERVEAALVIKVIGGGTVSRSAEGPYLYGDSVQLSANAPDGWRFLEWGGDLAGAPNPATLTLDGDKAVVAVFGHVNRPPDQPTMASPANGAAGVSTTPVLTIASSDPDGDLLAATFYGRIVTPAAFTLVALPDTQNYSTSYPQIYMDQTEWIVANRAERNLVFVTHLGDVTNFGDDAPAEWLKAWNAMSLLERAIPEIPYGIAIGNHDVIGGTSQYEAFFGAAHFQGKPYYGGHFGSDNLHNYQLFSAAGMDFIIIHLGLGFNKEVLAWADGILKANPNRRAIVTSHAVIDTDAKFSNEGILIYDNLKDNPNLFLILGGHFPGEARRADVFEGRTIYTLLADYQYDPNGGNGWLRLLEFSPATDEILVRTYSPTLDEYRTGETSQFSLAYDMPAPQEFRPIGSFDNVIPGSAVSATWPNLPLLGQMEWYMELTDGALTTTGPIWSFFTLGDFFQ